MLQNVMQGKRDSVIDGSVGPVGELVRIQLMISGCLEGPESRRSNTFMTTEVRATGRWSFRLAMLGFLGTGTMVAVLSRLEPCRCRQFVLINSFCCC